MNFLTKQVQLVIILAIIALAFMPHFSKANQMIELGEEESLVETISKQYRGQPVWFNYQVKMEANNGMPCCFGGQGYLTKDKPACSLIERSNSWGSSHSGIQQDSKTLAIYFKLNQGVVDDLLIAGGECPVERGNLTLITVNSVNQQQSVDFMAELIKQPTNSNRKARRVSDQALAAIAHHQGDYAHSQLVKLTTHGQGPQVENAIFWLGQARNQAGFKSLVKILNSSEFALENKKRAVFALSVNDSQGAKDKLVDLAKVESEDSIRSEAIFWVSQNNLPQALEVIEQALAKHNSRTIHDKAVFALSQLKGEQAWNKLLSFASEHPIPEVQKQAVFWLSQNKSHDSSDLLIKIALGHSPMRIREHAVFALFQMTHGNSTKSLVKVLQSAKERKIKQKAIFWLGQSKDKEALEYVEALILASN